MKKFFISLTIVLASFVAGAQITAEQKNFIAQAFPKEMPNVVIANTEVVPVTKKKARKFAKKYKKGYLYSDLMGKVYSGYIRQGDTLLVFNGKPYYSVGQTAFMVPVEKQKVAKQPKSPEQRAQGQQMILTGASLGVNVLGAILNKGNISRGISFGDGLQRIGYR